MNKIEHVYVCCKSRNGPKLKLRHALNVPEFANYHIICSKISLRRYQIFRLFVITGAGFYAVTGVTLSITPSE